MITIQMKSILTTTKKNVNYNRNQRSTKYLLITPLPYKNKHLQTEMKILLFFENG